MKRTSMFAGLLALTTLSTTAEAHEVPYGPAGCGLGHMILGNDAGLAQLLAFTTNGVFGNQSFGITTGTLGCDVGGSDASAAIFIEANREAVAKDISRGSGETLVTLAEIGECSGADALGSVLQANFQAIFPDASSTDHQVSDRIVGMMKTTQSLDCSALVDPV